MPGGRILVVFEAGRAGIAALELARDLAVEEAATLTVVSIAPQAPPLRGCAPSAHDYNATVRDTVAAELGQAKELLGALGSRAHCRILVEGEDQPLEDLVTSEHFDLVLLPGRRRLLRRVGHPVAARLRACAVKEVRIVDPGARPPRRLVGGVAGSGSRHRSRRR